MGNKAVSLFIPKSLALLAVFLMAAVAPNTASAQETDPVAECRLIGNMSRQITPYVRHANSQMIEDMIRDEKVISMLLLHIINQSDIQDLATMGDVNSARFKDMFSSAFLLSVHYINQDKSKSNDEIATQANQHCMELFGPKE